MATLRLLGSRILVRPVPPNLTAGNGLILVEKYQDHEKTWEVVQVGPKVQHLSPGDRILTDSFPSNKHVFTDNYRIIEEKDALMSWPKT